MVIPVVEQLQDSLKIKGAIELVLELNENFDKDTGEVEEKGYTYKYFLDP